MPSRSRHVPDALLSAPLCQAVYVSRAVRRFTHAELQFLADRATENNGRLEVTGLLTYFGGTFLQILEGRPDRVDRLLEYIWRDPRHAQFQVLHVVPIAHRRFSGWNMGILDIHDRPPLDAAQIASLTALLAASDTRAPDHGAAVVLKALRCIVAPSAPGA